MKTNAWTVVEHGGEKYQSAECVPVNVFWVDVYSEYELVWVRFICGE